MCNYPECKSDSDMHPTESTSIAANGVEVPTLTKEQIEEATAAFVEQPEPMADTDEAPCINEASCTDEAPVTDEGECTDEAPSNEEFVCDCSKCDGTKCNTAECKCHSEDEKRRREFIQQLRDRKGNLSSQECQILAEMEAFDAQNGTGKGVRYSVEEAPVEEAPNVLDEDPNPFKSQSEEDFRVECAIKYLNEHLSDPEEKFEYHVADVMQTIKGDGLAKICEQLPQVRDVINRIKLHRAEMQANIADQEVDFAERQVINDMVRNEEAKEPQPKVEEKSELDILHESYDKLLSQWSTLSDSVRAALTAIPGFEDYRKYRETEQAKAALDAKLNYDAERLVNTASDASKRGLHFSEATRQLDGDAQLMIDCLYKTGDIGCNVSRDHSLPPYFSPDQSSQQYGQPNYGSPNQVPPQPTAGSFDLGSETFNYSHLPNMDDVVKDGFGVGKDCRVRDIFASQLPHYEAANRSMQCGTPPRKLTPTESLLDLVSDMPLAMSNKIINTPSEQWVYAYDGQKFTLSHMFATRRIELILYVKALRDVSKADERSTTPVFEVFYTNDGLGKVDYSNSFYSLDEVWRCGKNAKRVYDWFAKVVTTFFKK